MFKQIRQLPQALREKISLEDPHQGQAMSCWLWTGAFKPAARRTKYYSPPVDTKHERNTFACSRNVRGTPVVRGPGSAHPQPAHRVVWAATTGTEYRLVPKLSRCANDRCVSPYHAMSLQPAAKPAVIPVEPEKPTGADVLEALIRADPLPDLGVASAADEAGLDVSAITPKIWLAYVAHCEATA